jgi:hypothetical protein
MQVDESRGVCRRPLTLAQSHPCGPPAADESAPCADGPPYANTSMQVISIGSKARAQVRWRNSLIIRVATTISLYSGYSRTRSVFSFALWQQRSQISQLKARVRIDSAPRHQPIISRYKPHIDNAGHQSLTTRRQRTQPRVILTVT